MLSPRHGASAPRGLPGGLAVLLAAAAGRQASSATARAQAWLSIAGRGSALLAPAHGSFNEATARLLGGRQQG
ncbi:hypothetical protein FBR43_15390 [Sphingomonas baiyangensis]|uniref:Uncharacterized protein n=1 Tax=Sphingomonas baiyangensis TaxID=2572576 RepID=A0A4U1L7M0_9SPHN|nr:hypothetical protein FBR43_15390 [Sphingomonas baiyangensis]